MILPLSPKAELKEALKEAIATADGIALAKTLGNLPPNICTPAYLAAEAEKLAREFKLQVEVLERKDMEKLGMGALLAVARASHQPPKLIVLHYKGNAEEQEAAGAGRQGHHLRHRRHLAQAGGRDGRDEVRHVGRRLGARRDPGARRDARAGERGRRDPGLREHARRPRHQARRHRHHAFPARRSRSSTPTPKGRLILCDALTYAERFKPDTVIDIATLTGAIVIALGHVTSGLFANDQKLADEIRDAADDAWDRVWQMPLWEDYQEQLRSNFADMANIGGRPGGSITAASFLARFTRKLRWAHLDIAGTAWKSGRDKGSTGRPVPLLVRFALRHAGRK